LSTSSAAQEEVVKKLILTFTGLMLVSLLFTGCNLPNAQNITPSPGGNTVLTVAAETAIAQLTLNALSSPAATNTTFIIPTSPATSTPQPTEEEVPCDRALFITDVTVEDRSEFIPGEDFEKVWRIENTGTCTWNSSYDLVFDSGDALGGEDGVSFSGQIAPGSQLDITIELTAPNSPGSYKGIWQLRNGSGVIFTYGGLWVDIVVTDNTPEAYTSKASLSIEQTYLAELDEGISTGNSADSDFQFDLLADDNKFLEPRNGAIFAYMGSNQPTYQECQDADLSDGNIEISAGLVGRWLCYQTDLGRTGRMKVISLEPVEISESQTLEISFTTWQLP
jgi:hypothetical protein